MAENLGLKPVAADLAATAERIYREWDEALSSNDVERLTALYAPDAVLESPLIPHLLGTPTGICRGRAEIRALLETVAARKPEARKYYRRGYFTDGATLMWEYPRAAPEGEQMDFVEVMLLRDGLIQEHRVYWGWHGFEVIKADAYHR
jgi:ketosteroid isomerase-like protein